MSHRDPDLISEALTPVIGAHRIDLLDALYCRFANAVGELTGNTEASDIEWFARRLWEAEDDCRIGWHWEQRIEEDERERYRRWARVVLRELPLLMSRVAHRCQSQAEAIQTILRADRAVASKERRRDG